MGQDDGLACAPERKAAVLAKMLPPTDMPPGRLASKEGISAGTRSKWRAWARAKGQRLPAAKAGPEGRTAEDKRAAVIGERLRRHRFEANRERLPDRGRAWRVLPAPRPLCRAAGRLARGPRAGQ